MVTLSKIQVDLRYNNGKDDVENKKNQPPLNLSSNNDKMSKGKTDSTPEILNFVIKILKSTLKTLRD